MVPEFACSYTATGYLFFANEKWANEESDEKRGAMDEEVQAPLSLFASLLLPHKSSARFEYIFQNFGVHWKPNPSRLQSRFFF